MNLEQLQGVVEIARTGNFTRAADALHLAQPSLSRQVAALERELGAELFHRARGHVSPTAAGATLLPYARRILADADAIRQEMGEIAGLRRGRVRLGATPSLCTSIVTEVVGAFRDRHPGIEISVLERGSRGLVDALAEGELDLALVTSSDATAASPVSLTRTPLLVEDLVVVSSSASPPLAEDGRIGLADLARLPLIAFPRSYDLRVATDAAFAGAGLRPAFVVEGPEMDAVLRFVERGVGVAIVPALVHHGRAELRATALTAAMSRTVSLARRADMPPSHAAHALQRTIVATADGFASAGAFISRAG